MPFRKCHRCHRGPIYTRVSPSEKAPFLSSHHHLILDLQPVSISLGVCPVNLRLRTANIYHYKCQLVVCHGNYASHFHLTGLTAFHVEYAYVAFRIREQHFGFTVYLGCRYVQSLGLFRLSYVPSRLDISLGACSTHCFRSVGVVILARAIDNLAYM